MISQSREGSGTDIFSGLLKVILTENFRIEGFSLEYLIQNTEPHKLADVSLFLNLNVYHRNIMSRTIYNTKLGYFFLSIFFALYFSGFILATLVS